MRKWLKWSLIILVPAIMLGAAQGYYWYQVKANLDELIAALRPFAVIQYRQVHANPFSPIRVDDVHIRPAAYQNTFSIQALSLHSAAWLAPLSLKEQLRGGVINDALKLEINGLRYDLLADYARALDQNDSLAEDQGTLDTLLCGDEQQIGPNALYGMGYRYLQGDFQLNLAPSANGQLVKLDLSGSVTSLLKGDLTVWLGLSKGGTLKREELAKTALKLFGVTLVDLGYNERWRNYCAKAAGIAVDDYMDAYRRELTHWLAREQHDVDSALLDTFVNSKTARSIIAARLEPAGVLDISTLAKAAGLDSVFSGAELMLQVNGKTLDISASDWARLRELFGSKVRKAALAVVTPNASLVPDSETAPVLEEIVPGVVPIRPAIVQKRYQDASFAELPDYIGHQIKVRTFFGTQVQGVLVEIDQDGLSIRHQVDQGRVTFPIARDKIAEVEVYR